MTANKALRSFTTIPDATMVTLLATVEEGVKKAKKGGVIQRLELSKKGYRQDLVFGDLYIVPPSVCASSESFPTILLMANLKHSVSPESMIDFTLHKQGGTKLDSDKLKMAKEEIFTGPDGKEAVLMVFCPSWADNLSYVSFPFNEDTIFYFLRDMVFSAPFNPSLSNVFEQMKALDPDTGYRIESIPAQQNIFKVPSTVATEGLDRTFPDLVPAEVGDEYSPMVVKGKKAAAHKFRVTAAHKNPEFSDEEVAVVKALEQQIQTNIGAAGIKPFKVDASTLAGAYKRATQGNLCPMCKKTKLVASASPLGFGDAIAPLVCDACTTASLTKAAAPAQPYYVIKFIKGGKATYFNANAPERAWEKPSLATKYENASEPRGLVMGTMMGTHDFSQYQKALDYLGGPAGVEAKVVKINPKSGADKKAEDAEVQADPEVHGTNIIMPEDARINPNDPSLNNVDPELKVSRVRTMVATLMQAAKVTTYQDAGVSSEGLRSRPDYGEAGSKETISSATVDGPDPKSAGFFDRKDKPVDPGIVQAVNSFVSKHSGRTSTYFAGDTLKAMLKDTLGDWKKALAFGESQGLFQKDGTGYTVKNRSLINASARKKAVDVEEVKMKGGEPDEEVVPGLTVENISRGLRLLDKVQAIGVELQAGVNTEVLADKVEWYLACLHDLRINKEVMQVCNATLQAIEDKPADWAWLTDSVSELRSIVENAMGSTIVDPGVKTTVEQHNEAVVASMDKQAISLLVPGRVLENFYPELLGEIVDNPENNLPNPNAVDPLGANPRTPEDMMVNPDGAPLGDSTGANPGPGGIGGIRAPYQSEGTPLRQEHNVRGTNYQSEFYRTVDNLTPSSINMAAGLKTAGAAETFQLSQFLKSVLGDFVGSLIAGFGVSKRDYPFQAVPAEFKIDLKEALITSTALMANPGAPAETLRAILASMTDIEIADALKSSWAQGAIWNDETEVSEGFTFEVYARAEKIDPATLVLTLKFVTGIR
jgi:hypothetical protein